MEKIGLIAGNRKFPIIFSQGAKKENYYIVAIAIKGDTSFKLKNYVDKIYWIHLDEFQKPFDIFKKEGITKVAMAGQINPRQLFSKEINKNEEVKNLFMQIKDRKADTIFGAIAEKLRSGGFELIDSTTFVKDHLPGKGTLSKRSPNFYEWEDIYFGFDAAKVIAYLDIGQTVAVRNKAIVAVEALEGTDSLIRRCRRISRGEFRLVKVSKPKQDVRFDIPVVGLNTIKNLIKAGGSCLAIEAGKTLFIDKEASIRLADKKNISLVAI